MSPITRDPSTATGATSTAAQGGPHGDDDARVDDGRSTRWDDHREARRAELVRVARKLVHHGGPGASMDDIAAAAGTSKSIVYRYFTDKDGLQLAVASAVVADIRAALDLAVTEAATPREALRGMVDTYLAMIESSPHVYAFVTRGGSVGVFLDSVTELVAAPFVRALGVEDDGPEAARARLWAAGAVGFVRGAGERWLAGDGAGDPDPGREPREEVASRIATWLWAGPVASLSRERAGRETGDGPAGAAGPATGPVDAAPAATTAVPAVPTTRATRTTRTTRREPAPEAPRAPAQDRVDEDAPTPGEHA